MPGLLKRHQVPMIMLFLASLLIPRNAKTDAVLVILGDDRIVLASDGQQIHTGEAESRECNIRQAGNFFWAATGVYQDRATGFNVERFFNDRKSPTARAAQVLDDVGARILLPLQVELLSLEKNSPDLFSKIVREGAILSLFAVSSDGVSVEASAKEFLVVNKAIIPTASHTCLPASGQPACMLLTRNSEIEQYAEKHLSFFPDDAVGFVDRLMKIGQDSDPHYIGPPVNILSVTNSGAKWLRQNDCKPVELWLRHSEQIASFPVL